MSEKMMKTSVYLPEDLHRRLKKLAIDRGLKDTEAMQLAIREWISGPPAQHRLIGVGKDEDPWQRALAFIRASGDRDAISAVEQNLVLFYRFVGGNPDNLPPVAEPARGFVAHLDGKPGRKRA